MDSLNLREGRTFMTKECLSFVLWPLNPPTSPNFPMDTGCLSQGTQYE